MREAISYRTFEQVQTHRWALAMWWCVTAMAPENSANLTITGKSEAISGLMAPENGHLQRIPVRALRQDWQDTMIVIFRA